MMKYYSGLIDEGAWRTASGDLAVFSTKYARNLRSLIVQLEPIQAGSGDPSPDNVRPISGRTGATVTRTGKNLLNNADTEIGTAWNSATNSARARLVIPCSPSTTYTLSMDGINNIESIYKNYAPQVPVSSAGPRITTFPDTFTTEEDSAFVIISFSKTGITQADVDALRLQLELGSTATDYEPYTGTTIPVSWDTEAGTVYGGELDVVSGVLTVDRILTTINQLGTWTGGTTSNRYYIICIKQDARDVGASPTQTEGLAILSNIKNMGVYGVSSMIDGSFAQYNKSFRIYDSTCSTIEEYMNKYGSGQICYCLAEPVTYQLTSQQIQTLVGDNVIWSDAGPVSVEFWG